MHNITGSSQFVFLLLAAILVFVIILGFTVVLIKHGNKGNNTHSKTSYILQQSFWQNKASILLLIATMLFAFFSYTKIGFYQKLPELDYLQSDFNLARQNNIRDVSDNVKREIYKLEYLVANNNKDIGSWWSLAKLYQLIKENKKAEDAFRHAYQLDSENNNILAQYIIANSRANNGLLDAGLEAKAIVLSSSYSSIYNVLAINFYKKKNYKQAKYYWQQLLKTILDEKAKSELNRMLSLCDSKIS